MEKVKQDFTLFYTGDKIVRSKDGKDRSTSTVDLSAPCDNKSTNTVVEPPTTPVKIISPVATSSPAPPRTPSTEYAITPTKRLIIVNNSL